MTNQNAPRLLIVGAGGFIGSHITEQALSRGYRTSVAVRSTTSTRHLSDPRLHRVVLDYDATPAEMAHTLAQSLPEGQRWDYIIYNLGATKCVNFADFNKINYLYLRTFLEALRLADLRPTGRLVYLSSLSALGPATEHSDQPLTCATIPQPNTRYGVSKIKAETLLDTTTDIPWTILRPTGVYGPREQDYLMMIRSIDHHVDFGVGLRQQKLTFIYVSDLVDAMFQCMTTPATIGRKYIISDGNTYTQRQFRYIVAKALHKRWVIPLKLPMWIAWIASVVSEKYGSIQMKATTLNRDKYRIMRQRNWSCSIEEACKDFGFSPRTDLTQGIDLTVKHYLANK